jgi:outer membrane receptor protein involved in Fe transport
MALVLSGAAPALAQGAQPQPSAPADDQDGQDIVVTAQKRAERVVDVPISISVIGGDQLDRSTAKGVSEVLTTIPGVSASMGAQGEGTQISIRGVGAGGPLYNGTSPIGYYLDSVPFGLVRSGIAPDANPYDLERVEVLRGPQGTLYGANAENGVVRIITADADPSGFELKGRIIGSDTRDGGFNYRGDVAVNVPLIDGKLAIRAVASYQNDSGWIDAPIGRNINDSELQNYRVKINAEPVDDLTIGLSWWGSRSNIGAPSIADDDGTTNNSVPVPISTDFDTFGLKLGYDFSGVSLSSMTSYLKYRSDFVLDLEAFGVPGVPLNAYLRSRVFSQEVTLNSTPDDSSPWRWSIGAFYRNARDISGQDGPLRFIDRSESYALYGEISRRLLDRRLEVTVGARYFHDKVSTRKDIPAPPPSSETRSFNATTPRVVLSYFPDKNATIYASYSQGFRSGAPQYYAISEVAPGIGPVRPDRLHNYELGAKADLFGRLLSLDGAIYFIDWKDVQQALLVPFGGAQINAITNASSASGLGIDLSATLRPARGLDLGGTFSWNDLTFDADVISNNAPLFRKGDRMNFSSKYTASAFANYRFPITASLDGKLAAAATYTSRQQNRGTGYITSGDNLFIARAGFTLDARRWSATLFADNLTNENGAYPAAYPIAYWYPRNRPRTIGLQLDFHL